MGMFDGKSPTTSVFSFCFFAFGCLIYLYIDLSGLH